MQSLILTMCLLFDLNTTIVRSIKAVKTFVEALCTYIASYIRSQKYNGFDCGIHHNKFIQVLNQQNWKIRCTILDAICLPDIRICTLRSLNLWPSGFGYIRMHIRQTTHLCFCYNY